MGFLATILAQPTVQAVGTGLLTGALGGGALLATGVIPITPEKVVTPTIQLLECPGEGRALASVPEGAQLLLTGRSTDGQWYLVYIGQPGVDRAWAPATSLNVEGGDGLPVADCAAPEPAPLPSPAPLETLPTEFPSPSPTLTPTESPAPSPSITPTATAMATVHTNPTPTPTPTPKPTKTPNPTKTPSPTPTKTPTPPPPTPTPTPTPTPDTTGPTLTNLQVTAGPGGNGDYYVNGPSSNCTPHSFSVGVTASDPSGVAHITLFYWPGNSGVLSKEMQGNGNNWGATVNAQDSWSDTTFNEDPNGLIAYWVVAYDTKGNTRQLDYSNNYRLYSNGVCLL